MSNAPQTTPGHEVSDHHRTKAGNAYQHQRRVWRQWELKSIQNTLTITAEGCIHVWSLTSWYHACVIMKFPFGTAHYLSMSSFFATRLPKISNTLTPKQKKLFQVRVRLEEGPMASSSTSELGYCLQSVATSQSNQVRIDDVTCKFCSIYALYMLEVEVQPPSNISC